MGICNIHLRSSKILSEEKQKASTSKSSACSQKVQRTIKEKLLVLEEKPRVVKRLKTYVSIGVELGSLLVGITHDSMWQNVIDLTF